MAKRKDEIITLNNVAINKEGNFENAYEGSSPSIDYANLDPNFAFVLKVTHSNHGEKDSCDFKRKTTLKT